MTRQQIITIARSYLGTPFHHQGRLKGVGVDCVGLVVCVMRELGIEVKDSFDYNGKPDSVLLRDKLREHFNEIAPHEAKLADILLFTIGKNPQHLGFVSSVGGSNDIIHTHMGVKAVVETHIGSWARQVVSAFEIPEVCDE